MATIRPDEVGNYESSGAGFFKLENDRDTAHVRFLYNTLDDVQLYVTHEVEVDGRTRHVNCLRNYNDPISDCPLCEAGMRQKVVMFIPIFNEDTGEVQIWQRGKSFINQISGLCSRFNPLVSVPIEIERQGKKGDTNTSYQFFPGQKDSTKLEDLPDIPEVIGTIVMDKDFGELSDYAQNGSFVSAPVERTRQPDRAAQQTPPRRMPPRRNGF